MGLGLRVITLYVLQRAHGQGDVLLLTIVSQSAVICHIHQRVHTQEDCYTLVPFADMMNHSCNGNNFLSSPTTSPLPPLFRRFLLSPFTEPFMLLRLQHRWTFKYPRC